MFAIVVAAACAHGAVRVPDAVALDEIDTTIRDADVERIAMPAGRRVDATGALWVALHTTTDKQLELVIGRDDAILGTYVVGRASRVTTHATVDVVTFDSRDHVGDYRGSILFAVRVPTASGTEQLVVFHRGASLRVAQRALGETAWLPVLALAFRTGTTFMPVGSADPH